MSNFLETTKFSSRSKKSATFSSKNGNLKHISQSGKKKGSDLQAIAQKKFGEMTHELKKRQERLMELERKNVALANLNNTLISDLRKNQSNSALIKHYEDQIKYLKESQNDLFQETCQQKQEIKSLQQKIEKYLEGTIEEKNLMRDYYSVYFGNELSREKSKNDMIIKELKLENESLKQIIQEKELLRRGSTPQVPPTLQTSKKSSTLLNRLLTVGTPLPNQPSKNQNPPSDQNPMRLTFRKNSSFQLFTPIDKKPDENQSYVPVSRKMSSQGGVTASQGNRIENEFVYPSTTRDSNEEKNVNFSRRKSLKNTQNDIFQTLNQMKRELRNFELFAWVSLKYPFEFRNNISISMNFSFPFPPVT